MSHLAKTILTGVSFVSMLLFGRFAQVAFEHQTHASELDWQYDLTGYSCGAVAVASLVVFLVFAFKMSEK